MANSNYVVDHSFKKNPVTPDFDILLPVSPTPSWAQCAVAATPASKHCSPPLTQTTRELCWLVMLAAHGASGGGSGPSRPPRRHHIRLYASLTLLQLPSTFISQTCCFRIFVTGVLVVCLSLPFNGPLVLCKVCLKIRLKCWTVGTGLIHASIH